MKKLSSLLLLTLLAGNSYGAPVTLLNEAGPVSISTTDFVPFDNPFTLNSNASDEVVNATSGSLFFRATYTRTGATGFSVVGISAEANASTTNGALTIGRDNDNSGAAILDVINQSPFDGVPDPMPSAVSLVAGTYTVIGEIEYDSVTNTSPLSKIGTARAWFQDDANPVTFSLASPDVEVDLEQFFAITPDNFFLWRGAAGSAGATISHYAVHFAGAPADRSAAFSAAVIPEPSSVALVMLAGVAFAAARRFRKKN